MDDKRVPRKETFIWRKMPEGVVEVEGATTHYLNPTGAAIWELINERNTVGDILQFLSEAGHVSGMSEVELRKWLDVFLNDLEQKRLISYDTEIWTEED